MSEKVSVKQAAKEIGCSEEYLRRQMMVDPKWQRLGTVVYPRPGYVKHRFFIFRDKLNFFLKDNPLEAEG